VNVLLWLVPSFFSYNLFNWLPNGVMRYVVNRNVLAYTVEPGILIFCIHSPWDKSILPCILRSNKVLQYLCVQLRKNSCSILFLQVHLISETTLPMIQTSAHSQTTRTLVASTMLALELVDMRWPTPTFHMVVVEAVEVSTLYM